MRAQRRLLFLFAAAVSVLSGAAQGQAIGWQDQRYAVPRIPGRSNPVFQQLALEHDMGRHEEAPGVRLPGNVTIRDGRAYLFHARSDDFPLTQFSGAVDGHGVHLIMSWPPGP
jgi:hypothetical protein